jgi:lysyl-tRNA synthetase class 2
MDRPLILDRYPAEVDCLARGIPGTGEKARWELYVAGVEIANCYEEETDIEAIRRYFHKEVARKASSLVPHAVDMRYPELLAELPPCSGVAIGFDRMMMVMLGQRNLDRILP